MKILVRLIISSFFALVGFFAMFLFVGKSLNFSLLTALGLFLFGMIVSSSTLDKIMKADDERNRLRREREREDKEIQRQTYAEEIGRLKAQRDFAKSEREKEEIDKKIKELADRIRRKGVLQ